MHDIHSAAQRRSHSHIVTYHEHRSSRLTGDPLKELQDLCLDKGVQGCCRLIRYNEFRLACKRYSEDYSLAHSAGKFKGILPHPEFRIADPRHFQQLL